MTVIDASAALGLVIPDESVDDERLQDVVRVDNCTPRRSGRSNARMPSRPLCVAGG